MIENAAKVLPVGTAYAVWTGIGVSVFDKPHIAVLRKKAATLACILYAACLPFLSRLALYGFSKTFSGTVVIGILIDKEPVSVMRILFLFMIIAGIVGLNVTSN